MFLSNGPLRIRERLISRPLERPSFPSLARSADQLHLLPLLLHPRDVHYHTYRSIDPSIASFECWPLPRRKCKIQSSPHRHFYTRPSHIIFLPLPLFLRLSLKWKLVSADRCNVFMQEYVHTWELLPLPHPFHLTRVEQYRTGYGKLCRRYIWDISTCYYSNERRRSVRDEERRDGWKFESGGKE